MFICTSICFLLFLACVSKIRPQEKAKIAANIEKPLTIKVGNLGTKPVCIYSKKTGTKRTADNKANHTATIPKNFKGL